MARTKLSDDEKNKIKEEKQTRIQLFKDCDYINTLSDDLILGFQDKLEKDYPDLKEEDAITLLFKKFVSGDFKFGSKTTYF